MSISRFCALWFPNICSRALVICAWTLLSPLSAPAEVTGVEIATTEPWLGGRAFGKAGSYEKLQGRVYFEVDPESSTGRRVTDIAFAPRNAKGRVEFSSDFVLVRPQDPMRARHSVLLEIPNRGLTQADGSLFSTAPGSAFDLMNLAATTLSDAFLFEQGFTVAWLGWQFDLPKGAIRIEVPAANVNGPVRKAAIVTSAGSRQWRIGSPNAYCASDAGQPDANLLIKSHFEELGRVLPRVDWTFAHIEDGKLTPDPCAIVLQDGFESGHLYELIYKSFNAPLAGLGEAAISDFVSMAQVRRRRSRRCGDTRRPFRVFLATAIHRAPGFCGTSCIAGLTPMNAAGRCLTASSLRAPEQVAAASITVMQCPEKRVTQC